MWAKPREIANYAGDGYEIAYIEYPRASAQSTLAGWKKSTGHNQVIEIRASGQKNGGKLLVLEYPITMPLCGSAKT